MKEREAKETASRILASSYLRPEKAPPEFMRKLSALLKDVRALAEHILESDERPEVVWHWDPRSTGSKCRALVGGDWSTDSRTEKVNCPRCTKMPTFVKAHRRRQVFLENR